MRYAMVLKNRVIDVLEEQERLPVYPPDKKGNPVTAIACDDSVMVGMLYDPQNGEFSRHVPIYVPTVGEQILAIVSKSKEEIENAVIDDYTEELIEGGLL